MWYLGFRQTKLKTATGIVHAPGNAVLCGPYPSFIEADLERSRRLAVEWDAAYSEPIQADSKEAAEALIEARTPRH
jgi:hypothetical protein